MAPEGDIEVSGIGARLGRNAIFNLFKFGSRLSGMSILCTKGPVLEGIFGLAGMPHTGFVVGIWDVLGVLWGEVRSTADVVVLQIFVVAWSPNLMLPRLLRSFNSFGSSCRIFCNSILSVFSLRE